MTLKKGFEPNNIDFSRIFPSEIHLKEQSVLPKLSSQDRWHRKERIMLTQCPAIFEIMPTDTKSNLNA